MVSSAPRSVALCSAIGWRPPTHCPAKRWPPPAGAFPGTDTTAKSMSGRSVIVTAPDARRVSLARSVASSSPQRSRYRSGRSHTSGSRSRRSRYSSAVRASYSAGRRWNGVRSGSAKAERAIEMRAARRDAVTAKSPARATSTSNSRRARASVGATRAKRPTSPSWSKWLFDTTVASPCRSNVSRYENAISAERSAKNSGGLAMPGQWERHNTVPGAGDPSTTIEGAPHSSP